MVGAPPNHGLPPADPAPDASPPPWPPWAAPLSLVAGLGATFLGATLLFAVALAAGYDSDDPPFGFSVGATLLQGVALVGAAVVFAGMTRRPVPGDFGLRRVGLGRAAGWLLALWALFFAFGATWASLVDIDEPDDLAEEFGVGDDAVRIAVFGALVCLVAPLAEEVFFRGFFFSALRNWRGPWPAAVLTGLTFGAVHATSADAVYLVPLAVFGFLLCVLYWKTGSLLPCIALHALNNAIAFGVSQEWGWEIPVVMAGSLAVLAVLLAPLSARRAEAGEPAVGLPGLGSRE